MITMAVLAVVLVIAVVVIIVGGLILFVRWLNKRDERSYVALYPEITQIRQERRARRSVTAERIYRHH